jgi:hypothetical protein
VTDLLKFIYRNCLCQLVARLNCIDQSGLNGGSKSVMLSSLKFYDSVQ